MYSLFLSIYLLVCAICDFFDTRFLKPNRVIISEKKLKHCRIGRGFLWLVMSVIAGGVFYAEWICRMTLDLRQTVILIVAYAIPLSGIFILNGVYHLWPWKRD